MSVCNPLKITIYNNNNNNVNIFISNSKCQLSTQVHTIKSTRQIKNSWIASKAIRL